MPKAAAGDRAARVPRLTTSTRALASPMAGTTQFVQLHCMPGQANLPMFCSHLALGQVRRPDNGGSSSVSGNKQGRIQVSGCKKTWAHSVPMGFLALARVSCSCGMMNWVVANVRLFILASFYYFILRLIVYIFSEMNEGIIHTGTFDT